jgi:hypothetical protein
MVKICYFALKPDKFVMSTSALQTEDRTLVDLFEIHTAAPLEEFLGKLNHI